MYKHTHTYIYIYIYIYIHPYVHIGCLYILETHVTANNSTNDKNVGFFFCFRFENSIQ